MSTSPCVKCGTVPKSSSSKFCSSCGGALPQIQAPIGRDINDPPQWTGNVSRNDEGKLVSQNSDLFCPVYLYLRSWYFDSQEPAAGDHQMDMSEHELRDLLDSLNRGYVDHEQNVYVVWAHPQIGL